MQRLTQLLRNLFVQTGQQTPAETTGEMTLHDVLRICAARVPGRSRPAPLPAGYRLSADCCLGMSNRTMIDFRHRGFGGRLAAYALQNRDSRMPR